MFLAMIVALVGSPAKARGLSGVTLTYIQKTNPPVRGQRQSADDDAFEILPDRVLQHVMRGDQLTRLRQYDQAVEEYRAALKEAGKPVFTVFLNLGSLFFNKED